MIWDAVDGCEHQWTTKQHTDKRGNDGTGLNGRDPYKGGENRLNYSSAFCSLCGAWRGSLGLEPDMNLYIKHLMQIFGEVWRVLKKTGTAWVNLGDSFAGNQGRGRGKGYENIEGIPGKKVDGIPDKSLCAIPDRFKIAMIDAGWRCRNEIIWYKRNCMPSSAKDRFTVDFEKIFFFTKSGKYWFEQQKEPLSESTSTDHRISNEEFVEKRPNRSYPGQQQLSGGMLKPYGNFRNKRCVWDIPTKPSQEPHFAVFPDTLVLPMLSAGCPEKICKKCGKAKEKILELLGETTTDIAKERGKDNKRGIGGKLVAQNLDYSGTHGSNIRKQKLLGYTDCGCNAGYEPGIVLDPFAGMCTVASVAIKQNKKFIMIELSPEYVSKSQKRIKLEQQQTKLDL